jgi:hypothetical protein
MNATTPCYRHSTWLASCDDCTDWHLACLRARRNAAAQQTACTTFRLMHRQPVALRPVA